MQRGSAAACGACFFGVLRGRRGRGGRRLRRRDSGAAGRVGRVVCSSDAQDDFSKTFTQAGETMLDRLCRGAKFGGKFFGRAALAVFAAEQRGVFGGGLFEGLRGEAGGVVSWGP